MRRDLQEDSCDNFVLSQPLCEKTVCSNFSCAYSFLIYTISDKTPLNEAFSDLSKPGKFYCFYSMWIFP